MARYAGQQKSPTSSVVPMPVDLDGDLVGDVTYEDLSHALTVLNQNFDNGTTNNYDLALP